jgi:membrane protease YdiL (CAAX protease family)
LTNAIIFSAIFFIPPIIFSTIGYRISKKYSCKRIMSFAILISFFHIFILIFEEALFRFFDINIYS